MHITLCRKNVISDASRRRRIAAVNAGRAVEELAIIQNGKRLEVIGIEHCNRHRFYALSTLKSTDNGKGYFLRCRRIVEETQPAGALNLRGCNTSFLLTVL